MFDWFRTAPQKPAGQQTERPAAALLRREFAGHPSRGLTPARLAQILQQAEYGDLTDQAALFQDMEEKDGHLAAELAKRKLAVTQLDWGLTPPRDASARERKAAQRLEDLIRDRIDLNRLRHDLLDAIGHGYACVEMAWQRGPDGLWWPETLTLRDPGWFQCPADDRTTLTLRDGSMDGAPLTPFGWIPHVHPARSGYLPRLGLHRVLAWPYLYKNYSVRDLAEFLEIYGLPIRLGKYPHGTDAAQRQALLDSLLSIGHHAAGIIPDSMQVEIVNTMASGNADGFQTMIDWCEATQSKAILGGTLTSQTGANGNRSLGDVHNQVRLDIRNDDAARLDRSLSDFLIYPIAVLNGLTSADRAPRFTSDIQEPDDLALYADALPKLVAIGAQIPLSYLHGKLKIPEPEGDEPILSTAPAAPVTEQSSATQNPEPTIEEAALSNPYHDSRGRFASHGGATYISIWGRDSAIKAAKASAGVNPNHAVVRTKIPVQSKTATHVKIQKPATPSSMLQGSPKQVAWATEIQGRYKAARDDIYKQISGLPEANRAKITSAIQRIDQKLIHNASASDIISRGGHAYFNTNNYADNVKALKEAIMSIAKGGKTVLDM